MDNQMRQMEVTNELLLARPDLITSAEAVNELIAKDAINFATGANLIQQHEKFAQAVENGDYEMALEEASDEESDQERTDLETASEKKKS